MQQQYSGTHDDKRLGAMALCRLEGSFNIT
jgi:hypothetical protein